MYKRPVRWMAAAALVLGTLTACSEGPGPTEVPVSETLSADLSAAPVYSLTVEDASFYTRTTGATLVSAESESFGTMTIAVIGPYGGTISAGDHTLEVPRGAVAEATEFRMEAVAGNRILVDLSARSVSSGEEVSWFPVPLTLTLSYKGVIKNSDAKRLRNVYLYLDSPSYLLPLVSALDKRDKTLSSPIVHFSLYGMAIE